MEEGSVSQGLQAVSRRLKGKGNGFFQKGYRPANASIVAQ